MNSTNIWLNGSEDPQKAKNIVEFLEERAKYPDQVQVNYTLRDVLNPRNNEHILEVGSGSGVLCRLMAQSMSPQGHVTGVEISPEMVKLSKDYAEKVGLDKSLSFEIGDASKLPYPDGLFDGSFAARLLLYINKPSQIITELIRVTKTGGRIVLMDWDFETLVVDHSNRELTRRIFHWRTDHKDGNNWSGRQLYRLLRSRGLDRVSIFPIISITTDENSSITQTLWHAAVSALEQKIITKQEYESWVAEIKSNIKNNRYFASIVYFIVRGELP